MGRIGKVLLNSMEILGNLAMAGVVTAFGIISTAAGVVWTLSAIKSNSDSDSESEAE